MINCREVCGDSEIAGSIVISKSELSAEIMNRIFVRMFCSFCKYPHPSFEKSVNIDIYRHENKTAGKNIPDDNRTVET
jgi:hypothetical protein